jgi:hypothetical protein
MFVLTYACLVSSSTVPRMLFKKQVNSQPGSSPEGATTLGGRTKWSANWGIVDGHLIGHEEIQDLDG